MRERLRDYDWDGLIAPTCARIAAVLTDEDYDSIAESFWRHYHSLDAVRQTLTSATDEQRQHSAAHNGDYARTKYEDPFGERWTRLAIHHADDCRTVGVPLAALLSSMAVAHSQTAQLIRNRLVGDELYDMLTISDTIRRLALVEADIMVSHLGSTDAARARAERDSRAASFRDSIARSIDGAAVLGSGIRHQTGGASASARGMLGKTSEVAAAAEQSAVAMREAAQTAAGLIRAIEDARSEVEAAAEIATRAAGQAGQAVTMSGTLSDHAKSIESILGLIRDIAGQTNLLALNATIEAARAGDAGRGFAVVAQEVKSLASQTARATDDIAAKIAAIQSATRSTVETNASIKSTVAEVQESAERIRYAMEAQAQTVTAITAAVDETALAADSMSTIVDAIRHETETVAAQIDGLGRAFGDIDDELGTLKAAAEDYARVA